MSALPNAVYTTAAMATSGKTVILVSSGNSFGNYTEPRSIITFTSILAAVTMSLFGSSSLPTAAYSAASMATAGKTIVLASSGNSFGNYARPYSVVISTSSSSPITYSISDTLSLSDSLSISASIAVEPISDTISLSDAPSILNLLNIFSSDSISLSDAIGSLNTYLNQPSDTISLSDSVGISQPLSVLLSDTLTVSDTLSLSLAAALEVSDTLQLSDALITSYSVSSVLAETLIFSDSLSQLITYATVFSDAVTFSDATAVRAIVPSRVPIWHLQQSMSGVLSGH